LPTLPEGTVRAEQVWKRFRTDKALPEFREQLKVLGKRIKGQQRDFRWVLRDVNLHVEPGHTQAIVGVNGSGKSTLLKIICKTTFPSAGQLAVEGRIGALLEVRSGIHPDLSGRQNVYLFGNILGLSRRQISQRFDDIIDFAEISAAVDRQVKFYSTGMAIRLGFAIAVYLDPEVLLVDEVLAVGDAHFQQKCLQRMSEVVANGTTLLFVSHDLPTVEAVCERALWLDDSYVQAEGPTREVLALYRASVQEQATMLESSEGDVRVLKVDIRGAAGDLHVHTGEELNLEFTVRSAKQMWGTFYIGVSQGTANPVFVNSFASSFPEGDFQLECTLQHLPLPKGRYSLWVAMWEVKHERGQRHLPWQPVATFDTFGPVVTQAPPGVMVFSPVHVSAEWELR
jgi:ABC-type polysaccharide/polyol phosphate transport system ATPase subunit